MQKNELNLRSCGIHLLNRYKTVASHLKLVLGQVKKRMFLIRISIRKGAGVCTQQQWALYIFDVIRVPS